MGDGEEPLPPPDCGWLGEPDEDDAAEALRDFPAPSAAAIAAAAPPAASMLLPAAFRLRLRRTGLWTSSTERAARLGGMKKPARPS